MGVEVAYGGEPGVLGKISQGVCGLPKESFRNSVFFKDLNTRCWKQGGGPPTLLGTILDCSAGIIQRKEQQF